MKQIIHISPHLGGGVGTVLLNYLSKSKNNKKYNHSMYCLDTINTKAKNILLHNKIHFDESMYNKHSKLLEIIADSDIVIIHWWNHPLLYEFIVKNTLPLSRVAIWSHVSGIQVPNIFTHTLFNYADYFVFSTPMSYLIKEVTNYKGNPDKLKDVWSTGGLDHISKIIKKEHEGFNVGYIGTVDYSKMHPNFINMCARIDIPNIKFIVCGSGHIDKLQKEVKEKGLEKKFIFTGFIENISAYLEIFDVFGYPLNPKHYGTCDQTLAEAMGCGIVPIVLNNNMEKYMVHNMYSGIVAKDEQEYVDAIEKIYINKKLKNRLEIRSKEEAFRRFSIEDTIKNWEIIFDELLDKIKTKKKWRGSYHGEDVKPYQIFLESIGEYAELFEKNDIPKITNLINSSDNWKSKTKGSCNHYNYFFDDIKLKEWSRLSE